MICSGIRSRVPEISSQGGRDPEQLQQRPEISQEKERGNNMKNVRKDPKIVKINITNGTVETIDLESLPEAEQFFYTDAELTTAAIGENWTKAIVEVSKEVAEDLIEQQPELYDLSTEKKFDLLLSEAVRTAIQQTIFNLSIMDNDELEKAREKKFNLIHNLAEQGFFGDIDLSADDLHQDPEPGAVAAGSSAGSSSQGGRDPEPGAGRSAAGAIFCSHRRGIRASEQPEGETDG